MPSLPSPIRFWTCGAGVADHTVQPLGGGWYIVSDGQTRSRIAVAGTNGDIWVFADGQSWRIDQEKPASRKRAAHAGENSLMSPMPATVVAIRVSPGEAVSNGDPLIVLEAMKMEWPLRSPRDGRIKAVHCAVGDLVQPGLNLLELE